MSVQMTAPQHYDFATRTFKTHSRASQYLARMAAEGWEPAGPISVGGLGVGALKDFTVTLRRARPSAPVPPPFVSISERSDVERWAIGEILKLQHHITKLQSEVDALRDPLPPR